MNRNSTLLECYPRHLKPYTHQIAYQPTMVAALPGNLMYLGINESFQSIYDSLPPVKFGEGLVGLEFEIEKISHLPGVDLAMWNAKNDSSLKDNGVEFVSCPIQGDLIRGAIAFLKAFLTKFNKHPPSYSWRTSTHVHLNAQDFTVEEIYKFLLTYMVFEYILFEYAGQERAKTNFCVPLYDTAYAIEMLGQGLHYMEDEEIVEAMSTLGHWEKYSALNLGRMFDFGTIEFRHMPGTPQFGKVAVWINFILAMREATKRIPFNELVDDIRSLNTTSHYEIFKEKVFGVELAQEFPHVNMGLLMSKGVMSAKCALFDVDKHPKQKGDSALDELMANKYPKSKRIKTIAELQALANKADELEQQHADFVDLDVAVEDVAAPQALAGGFQDFNPQLFKNQLDIGIEEKQIAAFKKVWAAGGGLGQMKKVAIPKAGKPMFKVPKGNF